MQSILQDYSAASVQSVDLRKSEPYCLVPNTSREIRRRISSSHHIQMWVVRTGFLVFWRSFPDPNPKLLKLPKVFANRPHFFPSVWLAQPPRTLKINFKRSYRSKYTLFWLEMYPLARNRRSDYFGST